mmetsp:Transcript_39721/g.104912  ORF Transcript_39721/g.104912 Transcript_39721/m.104912 type:complete len:271 (-) Transcript_39721:177-989(-)
MALKLIVLASAFASASALTAKPRSDSKDTDGVDRFLQAKVKPVGAYVASGVIVSVATGVQVATPAWMRNTFGAACDSGLGAIALNCITALDNMKKTNPLGLTLGHGVITKACADLLAQTIPQHAVGSAWIDPLRLFRSMMASVLSTSLPFYFWTRFMARSMPVAPTWVTGMLGKGFGTALFKTVVTQVAFRPFNVLLFLGLQSIFRGDTARQLVNIFTSKFKSSVIGGVAFYSVSNLLMYSVPVPFLHPIMGSVAGLIFNVWLACVAYAK